MSFRCTGCEFDTLIYYSMTKHDYATKRTFVLNCTNGEVVADARSLGGMFFSVLSALSSAVITSCCQLTVFSVGSTLCEGSSYKEAHLGSSLKAPD